MQTALWLANERSGCTQAEGMHRRQLTQNIGGPYIKPTSWHVHLSSVSLCFQNQEDVCPQCPVKSLIPLLFLVTPGYESDFLGDALTATGTRVKANKFAVFMKLVVKVCFRLAWLELERFMALQVVCRHDREFAPFCPPFTALCCRLVWERNFLTPKYINMKNSLRDFVPNTPTCLWLEIIPLSADYLCTCTLKDFKNIAFLRLPKQFAVHVRCGWHVSDERLLSTQSGGDCKLFQSMRISHLASWRAGKWVRHA